MTEVPKPELFRYDNYRLYLKDWFAWKKHTDPDFSYRVFSERADFKAPNQLLLLIKGERNLGPKSIPNCFAVLELGHSEKKYFALLVRFNQTRKMPEKNRLLEELSTYWLRQDALLRKDQYKYLTNWYFAAIREMVNLKYFREDGEWIAKRLGGLITPAKAEAAIRILLELQLLARDTAGRLVQTANAVSTGSEVSEVAGYLFHDQMIRLAHDSLQTGSGDERNITALTFTMRKDDYKIIVDEIQELRKRIVGIITKRDQQDEDDELYQLNLHLFPITRPGE